MMLSRRAVQSLHVIKSPRGFCQGTYASSCPNLPRRGDSQLIRYSQRTALAMVGLGVFWFADKELNASAVARNLRTLWVVSVSNSTYSLHYLRGCERAPNLLHNTSESFF